MHIEGSPLFLDTMSSNLDSDMWTVCNNVSGSGVQRFCPSESRTCRSPATLPSFVEKESASACQDRLDYYSVFMVPSCVVRPKQRPQVKASCKIYVHAAVSVGGDHQLSIFVSFLYFILNTFWFCTIVHAKQDIPRCHLGL